MFWCPEMSFKNEVVWLIYLKRAVKFRCHDLPWHATLDVPRPWFVLTRRNVRVWNMTPNDTPRSLTRHVPIYDSPSVVEYHGPINSTKLLISRSEFHEYLFLGFVCKHSKSHNGFMQSSRAQGNFFFIFFCFRLLHQNALKLKWCYRSIIYAHNTLFK